MSTPSEIKETIVTPRAWVARATIDPRGNHRKDSAGSDGVTLLTVSVHQDCPADLEARLELIVTVARQVRGQVDSEAASLWVFPGGYFGFDPSKSRGPKVGGPGSAHQERRYAWAGMDPAERAVLARRLDEVRRDLPPKAWLAVGVDTSLEHQSAWVLRDDGAGQTIESEIVRGQTPLDERKFLIGGLKAAFFVCGEVNGSGTEGGGPFHAREHLTQPARQLNDCGLLVDLAHLRVPGAIDAPTPNPRWAHQGQMEAFAAHGAGMLAHHHGGQSVNYRPRFDHQSNWIIFRGGTWLDPGVEAIP